MMSRFRPESRKQMPPSPDVMQKLLHMLESTRKDEITCDEVYDVLDQFAEAAQRGENVRTLLPLVRQHLDMCPDCREEYEALLNILQASFLGPGI
jgi:hypothetical protein